MKKYLTSLVGTGPTPAQGRKRYIIDWRQLIGARWPRTFARFWKQKLTSICLLVKIWKIY